MTDTCHFAPKAETATELFLETDGCRGGGADVTVSTPTSTIGLIGEANATPEVRRRSRFAGASGKEKKKERWKG